MSEVWNRTLVYLGLREEPEEMYDELPERFVPEDDPYAAHAPSRAGAGRDLVGAGAGAGRSGGTDRGAAAASIRRDEPRVRRDEPRARREPVPAERGIPRDSIGIVDDEDRDDPGVSNVRPLRLGDRAADGATTPAAVARVAVVEVERFDDVEAIGARYRTGQAVLFDVVGGGAEVGRRVVDFVAGLTYASRGSLTKAGSRAFLLVPNDVVIGAAERQRLRDLGYRVPATDA